MEMTYSLVEGKNIISPEYPVVNDNVTIKDSKGETFPGKVVFIGDKEKCLEKQFVLDSALQKVMAGEFDDLGSFKDNEDNVSENEQEKRDISSKKVSASGKQKAASTSTSSRKRSKTRVQLDSSEEEEEDEIGNAPASDISKELSKEAKRVNNLLRMSTPMIQEKTLPSGDQSCVMTAINDVTTRLDEIKGLLQQLVNEKKLKRQIDPMQSLPVNVTPPPKKIKLGNSNSSNGSTLRTNGSPGGSINEDNTVDIGNPEDFIVGGVNLLQDIPFKFKKPNLYATSLLSHLFNDEEMREGAVEPSENCKKKALDQEKINLLKRCIVIKHGEKVMEKKGWHDIRISLNQKCLDKLKTWKRKSVEKPGSESVDGSNE